MQEKEPIARHLSSGPDQAIWQALHTVDDRVTELAATLNTRQEMMRETIQEAVRQAMPVALLSDEEHRWVQMAIQREAQAIAFRRAVIEKSLTGLIWAGIVALGIILREYAIAHGMWKA